jgi:hypothetical protein
MKKALGITLLTVLAHLDAASEQRHPELVKGAPVSAHRQTRDARSGRVAGAGSLARPYAIALALLAGICLVLALAACGETNGIDIEATATAVALANDRPVSGTPEESASFESTRLGEWVEGSGLAMVAYAVEDPAVPNTNLYEPRPGTRLVGVELEIGCL